MTKIKGSIWTILSIKSYHNDRANFKISNLCNPNLNAYEYVYVMCVCVCIEAGSERGGVVGSLCVDTHNQAIKI